MRQLRTDAGLGKEIWFGSTEEKGFGSWRDEMSPLDTRPVAEKQFSPCGE